MPFCIDCGKEYSQEAKFCENCGAKVEQESTKVAETALTQPVNSVLLEKATSQSPPNKNLTFRQGIAGLAFGLIVVAAMAFMTESSTQSTSSQQSVSSGGSKQETATNAKHVIEIKLVQMLDTQNRFCKFFYDVSNKSSQNITSTQVSMLLRDMSGNIIEKVTLLLKGLTPGIQKTTDTTSLIDGGCSRIKMIELELDQSSTFIDGDIKFRDKKFAEIVESIRIVSVSTVPGISIKSNGGASNVSDKKGKTQISAQGNPLLEAAIDPFAGTIEKWSEFKDVGGLNKNNYFYGVPLVGLQVQWHEGKTVRLALMYVSKSVSPKEIRAALNKACRTKESDWKKVDGALIKGNVTNGNVECSYLTNDTAINYDVAIQVND